MKRNCFFALTALLIMLPVAVSANVIWPSLYIVEKLVVWYVILTGLVIEFLFIKLVLKESVLKTALMAVGMNAASAVIGLFAIPVSGLLVEILFIPFKTGTFHISHWIASYVMAVLCNVLFEGGFLKLVFKKSFRKNAKWLFAANALSVICAIVIMGPGM